MTPEGRVKAKLKRELKTFGVWQFWPVPAGYGKQMVDCLTCHKGLLTAIEVKREGLAKPTPRQAAIMREMRGAGARTFVVTMRDGELVWLKQDDS